jgi:hypothetical protein
MTMGSRRRATPLGSLGPSAAGRAGPRTGRLIRPRRPRLPAGIRGRAIRDGRRAAWAGQYDEWSFVPEARIAYLERLGWERDHAVGEYRVRSWAALRAALTRLRDGRRSHHVARAVAVQRMEGARRDRDLARDREGATLAGLDIMAGQHFPGVAELWDGTDDHDPGAAQGGVGGETTEAGDGDAGEPIVTADPAPGREAEASAEAEAGPAPDGAGRHRFEEHGDPGGPEPWADPEPGGGADADWPDSPVTAQDAEDATVHLPDADTRQDAAELDAERHRMRWLGPAGGNITGMMPAWLRPVILVLLAAVEIPIYLKVFAFFTGNDPALTWTFTLPIAIGMVLGPHLAGKLIRSRHALPREPLAPYLTAAIMVLWVAGGCLLGWLRQKVLLVPIIDPVTGKSVSLVGQLQVSPWTMTCVFSVVLLLSGLIAFILGVAETHPAVAAYQAASRRSQQAQAAWEEAIRAHAETDQAEREQAGEVVTFHEEQSRRQQAALEAEFRAAQLAYLDTVALETRAPVLTQAIGGAAGAPPPADAPADGAP